MKEKNLNVSVMLEYYGNMLTDRQREVIELYYNEDLSLQEISEHVLITRQGVRDLIVRGERVLFELEDKLGFMTRSGQIKISLEQIHSDIFDIRDINNRKFNSIDIDNKISSIRSELEIISNGI